MKAEPPFQLDLFCLVADNNMRESLLALLGRSKSLGIRSISCEMIVHPEHDPGCFLRSDAFLRSVLRRAHHALVILDREGCGQRGTREELEDDLEQRLARAGWNDRAAAVVIDPELEAWVFADSPLVDEALGWKGRDPEFRAWLEKEGLIAARRRKPERPKEVVEKALRLVRKPRSSAIYRRIAERVAFRRCQDPAFVKLRRVLAEWFPVTKEEPS